MGDQNVFVVGGGQIYQQWLPRCEELWWTRVWAKLHGDTRVELPLNDFDVKMQLSVPDDGKGRLRNRLVAYGKEELLAIGHSHSAIESSQSPRRAHAYLP